MQPVIIMYIQQLALRHVSISNRAVITLGSELGTLLYNYCNRYGTMQTPPKGTYNGKTLPSRFKFVLRVDGLVVHSRRLSSVASPW